MTIEMKTKIGEVTVFRDGARVTRTGKNKIDAGESIITISGITRYAHDDSFRVKGTGAAVLKSIDVKKTSKVYEPEEDASTLIADLKKLENERDKISDDKQHQQSRIVHLNSISSQFTKEFGKWYAAGESKAENLATMDKTILKKLKDAHKKIRELEDKRKIVQDKINVLQFNLDKIQGQRKTETLAEVKVLVDAKQATEIELEVTYQLSQAGWSPTYDVDLGDENASLKRIAMVYNSTLEDWNDVSLIVSTASARPVAAVEPSPFYVDEYQSYGGGIGGGMAIMASTVSRDREEEKTTGYAEDMELDAFMDEPAPVMEQQYAETSESMSGTIIYNVPGKITVVSEEDPHPITLTEEEFTSRKLYYWNAYAMPECVAQDEITNGDSVILPGGVKVYADGEFIGETHVQLIAPRETFKLGTRTAYDVKAKKKLVLKDTDKAGFTRGKTKRGYSYELTIESFSKEKIDMQVVDRIPHSTSEKIVVEFGETSLPLKKMELGVIKWEIAIPAKEKTIIEYDFDVEWEKEITIRPPLP
ncbi:MAG: mucoidy inhibitor MuiA family protein [Candidatus Thorarchaeota archaeon]